MNKPFTLRSLEPSEAAIQDAVLRYLSLHPRVAWAHRFNTGAHVVEGMSQHGRKTRRFIRYAFPGCADILGQLVDGRFLAVECKRKGEKPTTDQQAFIFRVNLAGGLAFVARSIDDVIAALNQPQENKKP